MEITHSRRLKSNTAGNLYKSCKKKKKKDNCVVSSVPARSFLLIPHISDGCLPGSDCAGLLT